jgi:simple sugar transport system substrate-binding protein
VRRPATLGAAALVLALLISGCDMGDEDRPAAGVGTTTATTTARAPTPGARTQVRIAVVTHGEASDPFWSVVKNGIDQAARDLGVDVSYHAADVYAPGRMRRLIEAAVASRPDGLVVTLPDAAALAPALRKATRAKIPVVVINAGVDAYRRLGAFLFVGQPEYAAGVAAGRRMGAAGVRDAICVVHQTGVASLQQRCRGFASGLATFGGRSTVLEIEHQQQREAVGRLIGWIAGTAPQTDGVLTLGPAGATPALAALREARAVDRIKLATFDLAPDILRALRAGEMQFAIDQQPYLQGYLPIVFLTQRTQFGLTPAEGTTIPTGPNFVTPAEAAQVTRLTGEGIR